MLLRHLAYYFLGRAVPGVFVFLGIVVFTRMLTPQEYGVYALVIAGVTFFNAVFFYWARLALVRFWKSRDWAHDVLLTNILIGTLVVSILVILTWMIIGFFWERVTPRLLTLGLVITFGLAWFELNTELLRASLRPIQYGVAATLKAVFALVFGILLVWAGWGELGPLGGMAIALLLASVAYPWNAWRQHLRVERLDEVQLRALARYGLPITIAFALNIVIAISDRFMVAWLIDEAAAGQYAAAYDLTSQTLGLLMLAVHLAGLPLAIRALEELGYDAARTHLRRHLALLLVVALPSAVGLALLSDDVASVMLGEAFRDPGYLIIAIVALAMLASGIKAYYLDYAFQLARNTNSYYIPALVGACCNVLLNLLLIPRLGVVGAAWSTLISFVLAALASFFLGRQIFRLPLPFLEVVKISVATLVMALVVIHISPSQGIPGLGTAVVIGSVVFLVLVIMFNTCGIRKNLLRVPENP